MSKNTSLPELLSSTGPESRPSSQNSPGNLKLHNDLLLRMLLLLSLFVLPAHKPRKQWNSDHAQRHPG
ncbi:hypothetical protein M407DRAFT_247255 [Tulasnella calospora MUT 4182]|uniref:Uncharacterized protein n=1 Tax=Tulasnella calospora MUT 4182 TaxID=1051891 RepID=A0A0C3Q095_9AGAM|nr:hypothetical protein M407DRAFT_247255 [Tulasnella calospora MUT 4182]